MNKYKRPKRNSELFLPVTQFNCNELFMQNCDGKQNMHNAQIRIREKYNKNELKEKLIHYNVC